MIENKEMPSHMKAELGINDGRYSNKSRSHITQKYEG